MLINLLLFCDLVQLTPQNNFTSLETESRIRVRMDSEQIKMTPLWRSLSRCAGNFVRLQPPN